MNQLQSPETTMSYSNSQFDKSATDEAKKMDEQAVRKLYESVPYPGPSHAYKKHFDWFLAPIKEELSRRGKLRFLDAGCGTGVNIVAAHQLFPEWEYYGVDLSNASLEMATQLLGMNGITAELKQGSYLDPLPFDGKPFDIICATGTVHHCAEPVKAMTMLRDQMTEDGFFLFHVYGHYRDKVRFCIKEILDLLEPDRSRHERRLELYQALMRARSEGMHKKRDFLWHLTHTSLSDAFKKLGGLFGGGNKERKAPWGPSWGWIDGPQSEHWHPWVDQFCHPCERGYQVWDIKDLVEKSGLKVAHMLSQGMPTKRTTIPASWGSTYTDLDDWSKWRIQELLEYPEGNAFNMILVKA
ncbi:MAG: methyltransferase domain-containing protein [Desulfovibrionaceae bacterium]